MTTISLTDAKARLCELISRVESGETFDITRRGKPVARLTAMRPPRKPIDILSLQAVTATQQVSPENAGDFVQAMRDGDRY